MSHSVSDKHSQWSDSGPIKMHRLSVKKLPKISLGMKAASFGTQFNLTYLILFYLFNICFWIAYLRPCQELNYWLHERFCGTDTSKKYSSTCSTDISINGPWKSHFTRYGYFFSCMKYLLSITILNRKQDVCITHVLYAQTAGMYAIKQPPGKLFFELDFPLKRSCPKKFLSPKPHIVDSNGVW